MPESTTSAGDAAPPVTEDEAVRQRVKGLTSQVLQQGRFDPDAVRDVVRAMIVSRDPPATAAKIRPAALSASVRIVSMGIPISSRAISPSNSAVACASFGDAKQPLALKNNQDFSKSDI